MGCKLTETRTTTFQIIVFGNARFSFAAKSIRKLHIMFVVKHCCGADEDESLRFPSGAKLHGVYGTLHIGGLEL